MISNARYLFPALCALGLAGGAASGCTSDSGSGDNTGGTPDASANGDAGGGGGKCGNGKVEQGERCDTAIAPGSPGACPEVSVCDDKDPCTKDSVANAGTCTAECAPSVPATADPATKDACCPSGATAATDADCNPNCGNGTLDSGEKCDPAIKSGSGACPTSCTASTDPCTKVALVTADPCNPSCSSTTITTAKNGDSCCPKGASAANDDDCTAVCGNGKVEPGEDCDDTTPQCKSCAYVPTAFRMTSLTLLDPQAYIQSPGDGGTTCQAVTIVLNNMIHDNFTTDTSGPDGGASGDYNLSFVLVDRPLDQKGAGVASDFYQGACTTTTPSSCKPGAGQTATRFTFKNQATGTCLAPDPANINPSYTPAAPTTAGTNGCFVSDPGSIPLTISGITLPFQYARIAAQWKGDPASGLVEGLFIGFLSDADTKNILLPASLGNLPFSVLFPTSDGLGCYDDRDTAPDGKTLGWYWHLNFEAEKVDWTGP